MEQRTYSAAREVGTSIGSFPLSTTGYGRGQIIFEILVIIVAECIEHGEELVRWIRYKVKRVVRSTQQRLRRFAPRD